MSPPRKEGRSSSTPALAVETFFIMFDNTMKGCTIMDKEPTDTARYKMMGKYGSKADAEAAMAGMKGMQGLSRYIYQSLDRGFKTAARLSRGRRFCFGRAKTLRQRS